MITLKFLRIIFIFIWLLFLDLISKFFLLKVNKITFFSLGCSHFGIDPTINSGLGFGLASDFGLRNQWFLGLIVFIVLLFFVYYVKKNYYSRYTFFPEILVLSGGIGNLLSRFFFGGVVDFLEISLCGLRSSIFNLADCYIVIGLLLIFYRLIQE